MKEAPGSSETSVLTRTTRRNNPEDTILHSHRRENLKSYIYTICYTYGFIFIMTDSISYRSFDLVWIGGMKKITEIKGLGNRYSLVQLNSIALGTCSQMSLRQKQTNSMALSPRGIYINFIDKWRSLSRSLR
jgi:hypothetical protein